MVRETYTPQKKILGEGVELNKNEFGNLSKTHRVKGCQ